MEDARNLRGIVNEQFPETIRELEELVRIPSCAFSGFDQAHVEASAEATRRLLATAGLQDTRIIEVPGGAPAVFGETPGPPGSPTVLLYAHHDVQPPGPIDEWETDPYEPVIRNGRMFGRGTADDKCGIVMHTAALRAFDGAPPVTIKVIVEGEEEATAEHLDFLIGEHAELLRCDAAIIADSGMYERGRPGITTSIRGVLELVIEVRVAEKAQHSGGFGGPAPDAIMALARIISSCHDDRGNVTVPGMIRRTSDSSDPTYTEERFREDMGLRPGVALIGDGALTDRLWFGPTFNVVGVDAPTIREASSQIVPVARALVQMRLAPEQDPVEAMGLLSTHLRKSAPWGVEVTIEAEPVGRGYEVHPEGPAIDAMLRAQRDAWGVEPMLMGMGGSIPIVPVFADAVPQAEILMLGPGDDLSAAHSINESVDLIELERSCLAEALFLRYLAEPLG